MKMLACEVMKNADVAALEERPERLDSVRVRLPSDILPDGMAQACVIVAYESFIRSMLISVKGRTWIDAAANEPVQLAAVGGGDHAGFNSARSLMHPNNRNLSYCAASFAELLVRVLILLFPTNISLIGFYRSIHWPAEFAHYLSHFAQPSKHEPCCLLGDSDFACKLRAAYSLAVRGDEPCSGEPFAKRQAALLEDRALADGELLVAIGTFVAVRPLDVVNLAATAAQRADDPVGPAQLF